ncbi:hypothetical protein LMG27174_07138 [Paraburkholderia rhynchosiae]|uniref:Uncharacterized protein n=1 Tax=Paraburkholderia rhynchosiae TaxID=487049 RepID=A0A6J5CRC2_9BURK|nr:hypothetical protein LMG27174_07138 [Paraburkholderia rhynchosiae]
MASNQPVIAATPESYTVRKRCEDFVTGHIERQVSVRLTRGQYLELLCIGVRNQHDLKNLDDGPTAGRWRGCETHAQVLLLPLAYALDDRKVGTHRLGVAATISLAKRERSLSVAPP